MLILTRRIGERIVINNNIWLRVMGIKGNQVSIGIDAPERIPIHREEIQQRINECGYEKDPNEWRKTMQVYDMLATRYKFEIIDGSLHYHSDDMEHQGAMSMTQHERLTMFINLTRMLDVISKGE